jgi:hypothetical protein
MMKRFLTTLLVGALMVFVIVSVQLMTSAQIMALHLRQKSKDGHNGADTPKDTSNYTSRHEEDYFQALEKALRDIQNKQEDTEQKLQATAERLKKAETMIEAQVSSKGADNSLACADLMSRPGSPYADGGFITRHTTSHKWSPRLDGSREFDLTDTCTLKRYTAADARQCLAGKHISFVGDSLSRYQFLSLAYFIDKGSYPPRFPRPTTAAGCTHIDERNQSQCSRPEEPNICMERDWNKKYRSEAWNKFFSVIGGSDDGGMFDGRMECNSVRSGKHGAENELYASKPGPAGERTIMSFLYELGWNKDVKPLKGFAFTNCALNGTCRLSREQIQVYGTRAANNSFDWQQDFVEALHPKNGTLRELLPKVDIAIYNRGLWGRLEAERATRLFPRLYDWAGNGNGRCFYKTTTGTAETTIIPPDYAHEIGAIRNIAYTAGCSFLDVGHITRDFGSIKTSRPPPPSQEGGNLSSYHERSHIYWDDVHFFPWVYEELNNVFLNVLCNWKGI